MAKVTQNIQTENAPVYLGYSREPDRRLALAAQDQSLTGLFKNVGDLASAGIKGADEAIQTGIKQDWVKAISPVIDEAGGNLTPDEVPAIAGTGARGAHYQAAAGVPGGTDQLQPDNVPDGLAKNMDGLNRMKEAYNAGHLSQSYFDARVLQVTKQLKQQYPGYEDVVDNVAASMYGVKTANDLRKDTLRDMMSMQAASNAAQNKAVNDFHTDAKYIQTLHPGMTVDQYVANKAQIDVEIGGLKAMDYQTDARAKSLDLAMKQGEFDGKQAESLYADKASQYVSVTMQTMLNMLRTKSQNLISQGANANPQEVQQFLDEAQKFRSQMAGHISDLAMQPLQSGSTNSIVSAVKDPAKLKAIQEQALAPIDIIISSIGAKEMGPANAAANIAKWQSNQDFLRLTQKVPAVRAYGAFKQLGPQFTGNLLQMSNGAGLPEMTKTITDTSWLNVANPGAGNEPPKISDIGDAVLGSHPPNPGRAIKTTVQGLLNMAKSDNPDVAYNAVKSLYDDPKFFTSIKPGEQTQVYQMLGAPDFTAKMIALGKTHPEAFATYSQWMERNAPAVYKQGIDDLQSATVYNRYNVTFDPKTLHYTAVSTDLTAREQAQARLIGDPAQQYVAKINQLGTVLAPILREKYGDQAPQHFLAILEANGYNPSAPKTGTWAEKLGDAVMQGVHSAVEGVQDYLKTLPTVGQPGKQGAITLEDKTASAPADVAGRWRFAYDSFVNNGWTKEQAAGIIGSLAGETGTLNPTQVHDGGRGLGIAGWNGDRLAALKSFAKEQGANYKDVNVQLAFVNHELNTTEKAAGDRIRQADTPEEAAAIFTHLYERPSIPRTRARMGNAVGFYKQFASNP